MLRFFVGLLLVSFPAAAQTVSGDPDLPIAFGNFVPDVCFGVANGHELTPESATALLVEPTEAPPAVISRLYPKVSNWYRSKTKPANLFVGVGDAPGRCHIVLANTTSGVAAFRHLRALLEAGGFEGGWTPDGRATMLLFRTSPSGTFLVILKGLTDETDGRGPQVSVDVGKISEERLRALLGK